MATTINAGRVRFVSRGTYNNSTQYYLFDLVDYNGSSYIAKENTLGNLPTNTQYWQLIAEKGNTGSTGQTGPVGSTGNGISSITKTGTSGLVDTYTITYTNGNTTTFTVTNGEDANTTDISKIKEEITALQTENSRLKGITNALPKISGEDTSLTLTNTANAPLSDIILKGNTSQNGEPTPATPQDIEVVTGDNTITISNSDNTEKQEFPISLGSLELCKIGDYQDYIYKKDDKWFKHKEIEKANNPKFYYNGKTSTEIEMITDQFSNVKSDQNYILNIINNVRTRNNRLVFKMPLNLVSGSTEQEIGVNAETYINSKDIIAYYILNTPIDEQITDTTLITQLNALERATSYDDTTNISQTNANLPFIINAEAFKKIS